MTLILYTRDMKLNFCPECAAPLTQRDQTDYVCANGHVYHNNPHASCSVVFLNDRNEILFSRRGIEPKKGMYTLPGGFQNYDEDAYHAAQREMKEELGVDIAIKGLEPIDTALHYYLENDTASGISFLCRSWQGEMKAGDDTESFEWKAIEFLQTEEIAWPYPQLYAKLKKITH